MTSLEDAIEKGYDAWFEDWREAPSLLDQMPFIAEAVRAWAIENAELYFGGYGGGGMPQYLAPSHYSVPLDKFGGDE